MPSYVPLGSIIAICSQSVGTAMHSFLGFMASGNITATSTPPPTYGPKQNPANNKGNASGHPHAGVQENNRSDHTERNNATGGHVPPGAEPNAEPVPPPCPPDAEGSRTGSNNRTNTTNTTQTPGQFQQLWKVLENHEWFSLPQ